MRPIGMSRRNILKSALSLIGISVATRYSPFIYSPVYASSQESVNWAGISYIDGEHADLNHTRDALKITVPGSNQTKVNKALEDALSDLNWEEIGLSNLVMEGYATTRYGMIFALATEMIIKLDVREEYTDVILRLVGYNILFNNESKTIVSTFPVRGKYLQIYEGSKAVNITDLFLEMITGANNASDSVASWYRENLSSRSFKLGEDKGWTWVVAPILHRDRVVADCAGIDTSVAKFKDMIGLAATAAFGDALNTPVSPFRLSRATEADMLEVGGDYEMSLKLPEPDYAIEIKLRGWQFDEEQITQHRKQIGLVVGVSIRFVEVNRREESGNFNFGEEFFNQRYRGIHRYLEMSNRDSASSRLSRVYILYEGLLEIAFRAIAEDSIRKQLLDGYVRETEFMQLSYTVMPDNKQSIDSQSRAVMKELSP